MSERVVIATLDVDESGAVRSVKAVEQQIGSLEKQTKGTADIFMARMTNMRSAAAAFLGTFTIAGGILAFKSFVTSLFEAQGNFKAFADSADKTQKSIFRLVGDVLGLNQALADTATVLDKIREMNEEARGSDPGMLGILWRALWGSTSVGQIELMLKAAAAVAGRGATMGPAAPAGIGSEPRYNPTGDAAAKTFAEQKQTILESAQGLSDYNLAALEAGKLNRDLYQTAIMAATGFDDLGEKIEETTINEEAFCEPSRWQRWKTSFEDALSKMAESLTTVNLAMDIAIGGAQAFAGSLATGILEGGLTWKSMIADMLKSIGMLLMSWGALGLVMAYFGYGPGLKASAIAFAAGTAALVAARQLSPRGGVEGSPAGAFGGAAVAGGGNSYAINVTVEGSSNPDMTGRRVALAVKRALADGAAGGAL